MDLYNQCRNISRLCSPDIHDVIGVRCRDLCLAMHPPLQTSLLNEMACITAGRILEDGTRTMRWGLGRLPMEFVLGKHGTEVLRVYLMQAYPQQHDDFGWLD